MAGAIVIEAIALLLRLLLEDFLKDKYPNIYQSACEIVELRPKRYLHISLVDEVALFSYFILEINDWVKDKGSSDCSLSR
ncbi:hypothetical protein [Nostoc commune]|uniref:hypothetical protein n=1 Tax=Nostoc commune TaxID=1178 RepID=UPI0011B21101|nr:hypothetical protein [Nostoc commune]